MKPVWDITMTSWRNERETVSQMGKARPFNVCCSHHSVASLSHCFCWGSGWTFSAHFVIDSWFNVLSWCSFLVFDCCLNCWIVTCLKRFTRYVAAKCACIRNTNVCFFPMYACRSSWSTFYPTSQFWVIKMASLSHRWGGRYNHSQMCNCFFKSLWQKLEHIAVVWQCYVKK